MLYDAKRWDKQTRADPFSLESLIAWLEKQPADNTYCYLDHGYCLLSQYFIAQGMEAVHVFSCGGFKHDGIDDDYPLEFDVIAAEGVHTFGAALERARSLIQNNQESGTL